MASCAFIAVCGLRVSSEQGKVRQIPACWLLGWRASSCGTERRRKPGYPVRNSIAECQCWPRCRRVSGRSLVEVAHMELASPSVADAIDAAVVAGAQVVTIAPYFLSRCAPGVPETSC